MGSFIVPDEALYDRHAGDGQGLDFSVRFLQEGHRWMAELVRVAGAKGSWTAGVTDPAVVTAESYGWVRASTLEPWILEAFASILFESYKYEAVPTRLRTLWTDGTHPVVYASAGKHHFSLRTFSHQITQVLSSFLFPAELAATFDRADGLGVAVTPLARSQVKLTSGQLAEAFHNTGKLIDDGNSGQAEINEPNRCSRARKDLPAGKWYEDAGPFIGSRTLPDVWGYQASFASGGAFCGTEPEGCDVDVDSLRKLLLRVCDLCGGASDRHSRGRPRGAPGRRALSPCAPRSGSRGGGLARMESNGVLRRRAGRVAPRCPDAHHRRPRAAHSCHAAPRHHLASARRDLLLVVPARVARARSLDSADHARDRPVLAKPLSPRSRTLAARCRTRRPALDGAPGPRWIRRRSHDLARRA